MAQETELVNFPDGGYRYLKGVYQYSGGVAAQPGHAIDRVLFARPMTLTEGFKAIASHLASIGRPLAALCACELRSPAPFSEDGFDAFNRRYADTLETWGLVRGDRNPVARTNVCPQYDKPREPVLYAFSYTVPADSRRGSFIIAGGAEVRGGVEGYAARTVRHGDTSASALREKLRYVVELMEGRLKALGYGWADAIATSAYTVHDIGALIGPEIVARGAAAGGLTWHLARPPVEGLEFEMDVRGPAREIVL